ncbi:MAG: NAD(P)-dependent oxidoreductase, partial [Microthrixaceae bacterium]
AWLCDVLDGTAVRLVHVGSASEYGDPLSTALVSELSPLRALGDYACSKAAGTKAVLSARAQGLDAVVARVFNIVGHPVPEVSPIHQWLSDLQALKTSSGSIDVWWPETTRDFVMIEDVATALVHLAEAISVPPIINLCSGIGLKYGEIAEAIAEQLDIALTVNSLNMPGIESVIGDPELLRETIGWVPTMSLDRLAKRVTGRDQAGASGGGSSASR